MSLEKLQRLVENHVFIDEYILRETRESQGIRRASKGLLSSELAKRHVYELSLFRDLKEGRSQNHLSLAHAQLGGAASLIDRLMERARPSGPSWFLPKAAAPAQVVVSDPAIAESPSAAAHELMATLGPEIRDASCTLVTSSVLTSTGFGARYDATLARVSSSSHTLVGRKISDLRWRPRDAEATADTPRGRYDVIFEASALESVELARFGMLSPIVGQCDAELHRRGNSHYRLGQAIAPGPASDLRITSDGTVNFGELSRPFADDGSPTRRFDLVRDGRAAELGLTARSAALSARQANGGVRGLRVNPGTTPWLELVEPTIRATLTIHELSWLNLGTSTVAFGVARATRRGADGTSVVSGGVGSTNPFALFAHGTRSKETQTRRRYSGPQGIRVNDIAIR